MGPNGIEAVAIITSTGAADDGSDYYRHWLAALERLTTSKDMTGPAELADRKQAWETAYLTTPHGKPVSLK